MNNKDINEKIENEMSGVTLPESISAEKIEQLINEKGKIAELKVHGNNKKKIVAKVFSSVAAVLVLCVGVAVVYQATRPMAISKKSKKNSIVIENSVKNSDYSKVESAVLKYYKSIYESEKKNNQISLFGLFERYKYSSDKSTEEIGLQAAADSSDNVSESANGSFSQTNLQVSGVDEGDIIKNDGRYIYYAVGDSVVITDAQSPKKMDVTATVTPFTKKDVSEKNIDSGINEIYVYDNKLVVIYYANEYSTNYNGAYTDDSEEIAYCYTSNSDTFYKVYSLDDKSSPKEIFSGEIDGVYSTSRIIDGRLLIVSSYDIPYQVDTSSSFDKQCEQVKEYAVPTYSTNGTESKIAPDNIDILDEKNARSYVVTYMAVLDDMSAKPYISARLGSSYEIYCTAEHLYIVGIVPTSDGNYNFKDKNGEIHNDKIAIYKYNISEYAVTYSSKAESFGSLLDQFSIDEYKGYLRVALTDYTHNGFSNLVCVFDKDMNEVGRVDGIAPGENIYAVRFMGDTACVVTFLQTDPLFVLDMSNPEKPEIKGELKIPGFSSYLHPINATLIVGIGTGGDSNSADNSAKVSLFDISDPMNPREVDNYTVPNAWFDTSHKAYTVIDSDTFAICVSKYNDRNVLTNSIISFDVSEDGLTLAGEYKCFEDAAGYSGNARCAFIDNSLFAVNDFGIISYDIKTDAETGKTKFGVQVKN